jgi:hypothetical protein
MEATGEAWCRIAEAHGVPVTRLLRAALLRRPLPRTHAAISELAAELAGAA